MKKGFNIFALILMAVSVFSIVKLSHAELAYDVGGEPHGIMLLTAVTTIGGSGTWGQTQNLAYYDIGPGPSIVKSVAVIDGLGSDAYDN